MVYILILLYKIFVLIYWIIFTAIVYILSSILYVLKFLWNLKKPKWTLIGGEEDDENPIEMLNELLNTYTYKETYNK